MNRIKRKLVIVGDGTCGKTSMLTVFVDGKFPLNHEPTVFETKVHDIELRKQIVEMELWDTSGQEDYDRFRPLMYPDADVVLLCFSLDSTDSLENIGLKWAPEVKHFCPKAPIILVGNKLDLLDDLQHIRELQLLHKRVVTEEDALTISRKIGAKKYLPCSAKLNLGIREIFVEAANVSLRLNRKRKTCQIL